MTTRRRVLALTGAAVTVSVPFLARAQASRKLVVAAITPASLTTLPVKLAMNNGHFEREHLELDFVYTGSLASNIQNVVTGNADLMSLDFESLILAVNNGAPIIGFASTLMKYCYSFITAPSVTKPADIKGKTVISDKPNSICSVSFVEWAKRNGLAVEDFDLTFASSSPNRLAALTSAAAAVAALTQPLDLLAISRGYRRLFDLATDTTFAFANFSARKAFVANNPETITAWIRATRRGTADFYNLRDTDFAVNVLVADSKVEPTLARRTIDYLRSIRAFSSSLGIPDAYVQNTVAFLVRNGSMKPPIAIGNYVDRRFCPNSS